MSKRLHTNDSPLNLLDLDAIAKHTSFIQRKTQSFSALSIILALFKCLQKGDASFNLLAGEMRLLNLKSLCRGAIYKRLNQTAVDFLQEVILQLIASQKLPKLKQKITQRFKRILVEDSTFVPMGAINAANFPACGNQTGVTAGFKLDLSFDVLTNTIVHQSFASARESDKKLGERLLTDIQPGDLVLRDMGYFGCAALNLITEKEAFWISRLPSSINVFTSNGEPLEKKLRSRKNNFIDEVVTLGNDGATKVRLVGIRADNELAAKRRRSRKTVAQKFGNSPKHQSLVRDGWHLILTNLDQDVTAKELFEIYSIRWCVEIRFKAWKQSLNMKPTLKRYTNYHHLCCIALAALIQQLVVNHIFMLAVVRVKRALSYEKVSEVINQQLSTLSLSSLGAPLTLEDRHVWMDKRFRKSLYERLLAIK